MKLISLFFLLMLLSINTHAYLISEGWNQNLKKEIELSCLLEEETNLCASLCNNPNKCIVKEGPCRNCAGTDLYIRNLFTEMGTQYHSTNEVVDKKIFFDYIATGNFVSISSRSIFNLTDSFDGANTRLKFMGLCNFSSSDPIVFLNVEPVSRKLKEVRYVVCMDDKLANDDPDKTLVYKMIDNTPVMIP